MLDCFQNGKFNNEENNEELDTAPRSLIKLLKGSNISKQIVKV